MKGCNKIPEPIRISIFNSFLKLDQEETMKVFGDIFLPGKMTFDFKSFQEDGLLFYAVNSLMDSTNFIAIEIF